MNEPVPDPRIVEAMEACRPGSKDVLDPGLAFLAEQLRAHPEWERQYRRLQRVDQALADAFRDVAVPQGLADRILARLARERAPDAPPEGSLPKADRGSESAAVAARWGQRVSRRWLLGGIASVAAAASLLVAVSMYLRQPPPIPGEQLGPLAIEFFLADDGHGGGVLVNEIAPPAAYRFSAALSWFPETTSWRWVEGLLDAKAVAYDLVCPTGERATLYVLRRASAGLPTTPSPTPAFSTHGCSTTAWQADGLLYLLVVEGGTPSYRKCLASAPGSLT